MITAILQARYSSRRLPGKVLKPILGVPMLLRQVERIRRSKLIEQLIVATSTNTEDDAIEVMCQKEGVQCYRGSLEDVLDRFYQAAKLAQATQVVRLTGDCPLTDPALIDEIINVHLDGGFDYTSNALTPTYPDGLDAEVMTYAVLEKAWQEARLPSEREHVTPFINKHPERFCLAEVKGKMDFSELRWTVDEPADFMLIDRIYQELYPINPTFNWMDVLAFINSNDSLKTINSTFKRNEGMQKSLRQDAEFLQENKDKEGI